MVHGKYIAFRGSLYGVTLRDRLPWDGRLLASRQGPRLIDDGSGGRGHKTWSAQHLTSVYVRVCRSEHKSKAAVVVATRPSSHLRARRMWAVPAGQHARMSPVG